MIWFTSKVYRFFYWKRKKLNIYIMETRQQKLDAGAIFFVDDMVSCVIRERGYRWQSSRKDFPLVRPEFPLYSFTPELERSITLFYFSIQEALATSTYPLIVQIFNVEPQNRCNFMFRSLYNILNPYTEGIHLSKTQWIETVYLLMVTSIDICLFYYIIGQVDIVRDIIVASEIIIRYCIIGDTPIQRFAVLQDFAEQL